MVHVLLEGLTNGLLRSSRAYHSDSTTECFFAASEMALVG